MTKAQHRLFCFWFLIYAILVHSVHAQELKGVIPLKQDAPPKTFPPKAAEQTPSGTRKFVIFTREDIERSNQWDAIAGAWECIPSRPELPLTKRIEFCHSSWSAGPLLGALARDCSEDHFPRFVRLQVDAKDRIYSVNLYDINYRTWEVRRIWSGSRLSAFGVMNGSVFCDKGDGWFSLDASTGLINKNVPFIPIGVDAAYWLVRKNGDTSGYWSYDPSEEKYVARFADVDAPTVAYRQALLAPDGKSRAWVLVPLPPNWNGGVIEGTLLLQRDGRSEDISVPIQMQAHPGSGVPVIPTEISLQFTAEGKIEFAARTETATTKDRTWTIDIASGKLTENTRPHVSPAETDFSVFGGVPTPEYLRPYLKNLTHFGRKGLAPAFLMHLGVLKAEPEYPDCEAGVSLNGRYVLYKAKKGPLADVFIYGDLQTKQTLSWPTPHELKQCGGMEFVWVEAP